MMEDYIISEKYTVTRRCINCNTEYKEMNNIGKLLCRVHPGLKLCDNDNNNYYSCCGLYCNEFINCNILSSEALGCLYIDHMCNDDIHDGEENELLSDKNIIKRI